jgi:hypothetical protein
LLPFAFDYIIEAVLSRVGLGVVDESIREAGLSTLVAENESKLIFVGHGNSDGFLR